MATTPPATTPMPTSQLSPNDSAILSALFNPESSPTSSNPIAVSAASSTPTLPHIAPALLPTLRARESLAIRPLHTPSPTPAAIETTIQNLSSLISAHPNYAPAYLNRAQATRLRLDAESHSEFFAAAAAALPLTTQLFSDLSTAITLTTPTGPISQLQADLLANAHTHRGYLLLKAAATADSHHVTLPPTLHGLSGTALEELASRDFALGGRYGNKIARQLSVQTNPYAKACGAIVTEALKKERDEFAGAAGVEMV